MEKVEDGLRPVTTRRGREGGVRSILTVCAVKVSACVSGQIRSGDARGGRASLSYVVLVRSGWCERATEQHEARHQTRTRKTTINGKAVPRDRRCADPGPGEIVLDHHLSPCSIAQIAHSSNPPRSSAQLGAVRHSSAFLC